MTADLHAEKAVIGAVLLDARALDATRTILAPDDFHRGAHRSIYETVLHLAAEGVPVDAVTVTDELERRGHLADVGGAAEVAKMISDTPSAHAAVHYARIVADLSARRRLAALCQEAGGKAQDLTVPLDEARTLLADLPTSRAGRIRCLSSRELELLPEPEWLIDGILPKGLNVVYGPSESGKSLLSCDFGWSMAAGRKWFGKDVKRGHSVYVAGEGHEGLKSRREAWVADRAAGTDGWFVIPDPVNLFDPADVEAVSAYLAQHKAQVLWLDTLARTWTGDENSTADMGRYVAACDQLRARHGCTVVIVHHTGHDATRMRGNTALFGAADSVIRVEPDMGQVKVSQPDAPAGKAKDAPRFKPWFFKLKAVKESVVLSTGVTLVGGAGVPPEPPEPEERELAW